MYVVPFSLGSHPAVAGDALQLGPVVVGSRLDPPVHLGRTFRDSFLHSHGATVLLLGSHRQSRAGWFVQCLYRIRTAEVTDMDVLVLNATSDAVTDEVWLTRTQLCAKNADGKRFNRDKLTVLAGAEVVYPCRDEMNHAIRHPKRREYAAMRLPCSAPVSVTLKPGAVVMTTRVVEGIPSATQGSVVSCTPSTILCEFGGRRVDIPYVSFDLMDNCTVRLASRSAVPMVLGWCMTTHRAQGTSQDSLAVDFTHLCWREAGLVYYGLSRCRFLESLCVRGLRREHIVVSEEPTQFYASLRRP